MRTWQNIFPEEDRKVYSNGGFGKRQSVGKKAALLVVDVVDSFTGKKNESVTDPDKKYRTSCGQNAWKAIPNIKKLIEHCRSKEVEIIYTKGNPISKAFCGSSTKGSSFKETIRLHSTGIVDDIKPLENEFVIEKTKSSAFFGTPLSTYLRKEGVDTLIITGTTTSGCIRSTVTDAYSHGFKVFVVEDCCFDRSSFSHMVNLFEMDQKYADILNLKEAFKITILNTKK